jgi:ribonuclease HIII
VNLLEEKAHNLISDYSRIISEQKLEVTTVIKKQYNYEVNVVNNKESVKLLVYFGKKGNKAVVQGDKSSKLFEKVNNLIFGESLFDLEENDFKEPEEYIGTDESGKGDYFGPLVIAGVFSGKENLKLLKQLGVKDSKQLADSSIRKIAKEIENILENTYNVIVISPEKYNKLFEKMGNVNRILGWAHAKVLENILEKHYSSQAISDKFGDERLINDALQTKGKKIILHQFTKAERYTAVAAASILAREKFCEWFDYQKKILGLDLPKGASSNVERVAAEIRIKYGMDKLKELVKIHFKTTKKIIHQ